jgi:hypothetical protein
MVLYFILVVPCQYWRYREAAGSNDDPHSVLALKIFILPVVLLGISIVRARDLIDLLAF